MGISRAASPQNVSCSHPLPPATQASPNATFITFYFLETEIGRIEARDFREKSFLITSHCKCPSIWSQRFILLCKMRSTEFLFRAIFLNLKSLLSLHCKRHHWGTKIVEPLISKAIGSQCKKSAMFALLCFL